MWSNLFIITIKCSLAIPSGLINSLIYLLKNNFKRACFFLWLYRPAYAVDVGESCCSLEVSAGINAYGVHMKKVSTSNINCWLYWHIYIGKHWILIETKPTDKADTLKDKCEEEDNFFNVLFHKVVNGGNIILWDIKCTLGLRSWYCNPLAVITSCKCFA